MAKRTYPLSRRRLLAASGSILGGVGLAGCLDNQVQSSPDTTSDSSPDTTSEQAKPPVNNTSSVTTSTTQLDNSEPKDITIEPTDGSTIQGTIYGDGTCGIVLVPQINLDRASWEEEATRLAKQGNLVLAIDENPDDRAASVLEAIRYLRQDQQVQRLILIGASSGGEAVVVANAKAPVGTVDGTITLSAAGGSRSAEQLQGRLLFIVSKNDEDRFVTTAQTLHQNAPNPKQLKLYSGDAHGQRLFDSAHADALQKQITKFTSSVCTQ